MNLSQRLRLPDHSAARKPLAVVLFLLVAAAGLAADLYSKHAVFNALLGEPALAERVQEIHQAFGRKLDGSQVLHVLHLQQEVWPAGKMKFTLSTNPGVVFGLAVPRPLVAIATVLTVGVVLLFFATSDRKAWSVHLALAMILGGALGNLYDRLVHCVQIPNAPPICYQVRDFIDFSDLHIQAFSRDWNYPWIFNVADVLLVVGVAILLVHMVRGGPKPARKQEQADTSGLADK